MAIAAQSEGREYTDTTDPVAAFTGGFPITDDGLLDEAPERIRM
jgi:hypothetical protein